MQGLLREDRLKIVHILRKCIVHNKQAAIAEPIYQETGQEFIARVRKTIPKITYCNNLLSNVLKRNDAVIKCTGFKTKY